MWSAAVRLGARIRAFFRSGALDRDFEEELASHLTLSTEENLRRGMTADDARRAAALRLGNFESTKQLHRDVRGLSGLEGLLQDARYAVRRLRQDAGFTLFAVLIVGLGIGACTTVFSVVNALLLRPLPFTEPERLVWIANTGDGGLSAA